jgi:hypothetical protein
MTQNCAAPNKQGEQTGAQTAARAAAMRQFESDLDRLTGNLFEDFREVLDYSTELILSAKNTKNKGKRTIIINDAQECAQEAFENFSWPLHRALRQLREAMR